MSDPNYKRTTGGKNTYRKCSYLPHKEGNFEILPSGAAYKRTSKGLVRVANWHQDKKARIATDE